MCETLTNRKPPGIRDPRRSPIPAGVARGGGEGGGVAGGGRTPSSSPPAGDPGAAVAGLSGERPGVGGRRRGRGSAPRSRKGPRGQTGRPLPGRAGPRAGKRSPFRDLPSLLGGGSGPEGAGGGRAQLRAPGVALPFPPAAAAPSTWHLLQAAPAGTRGGAVHPPGSGKTQRLSSSF